MDGCTRRKALRLQSKGNKQLAGAQVGHPRVEQKERGSAANAEGMRGRVSTDQQTNTPLSAFDALPPGVLW